MLQIPPIEVTVWIEKLEDRCKYDAASTCSSNISLQDLIEISLDRQATTDALSLNLINLTNGPARGSGSLRTNIAALYPNHTALKENILTTNGGIVGNQVVLQALLSPKDHVICMYPTYEQLYQTPTIIGAEVTLWRLDGANEWALDLDFLRSSIKANTKMIILNSPNNPTGAYLSRDMQKSIVEVAKEHDLILFCDEVFRPLFRLDDQNQVPGSFLELDYENALVVGSLSKAYSLASVRVGWIASKSSKLLESRRGGSQR
ncbi:hypothetical protein G7Z17_g445 [Cylindrodendrum hubeiense]|uniref:Aminotransferase class I/classII large domain-containing protein n=1 Tax=Cylindrodendrum hubeiense TaxID=595255 RepID=A0A9P5HL26_9HYPO|nr:hypothetical protein G7Z17_g445 [Cylindrodendrum hubeiense]